MTCRRSLHDVSLAIERLLVASPVSLGRLPRLVDSVKRRRRGSRRKVGPAEKRHVSRQPAENTSYRENT